MVSARARMSTRPAPDREPAISATPSTLRRGPSLMKGPVCERVIDSSDAGSRVARSVRKL